jgi:hypothetical protein
MRKTKILICSSISIIILAANSLLYTLGAHAGPPFDSFSNGATPTDTPTPTTESPRDWRRQGPKEKGDEPPLLLQQGDEPDLIIEEMFVTPSKNVGVGAVSTLTVVVRNSSSVAVTNAFSLDVYFARENLQPLQGASDIAISISQLGSNTSVTQEFSFTAPLTAQQWRAWAEVDRTNQIAEVNETNNVGSFSFRTQEIKLINPSRVLLPTGGSITFEITGRNVGLNWDWPPNTPSLSFSPQGIGTFGDMATNTRGNASVTFVADETATGVVSGTVTCGVDFERMLIEVRPPGLVGASVVPGLTKYQYQILPPVGETAANVVWSLSGLTGVGSLAEAFIESGTNQPTVVVYFRNIVGLPTITVNYQLGEVAHQNSTSISIVKIELLNHFLANAGRPATLSTPAHIGITGVAELPRKEFVTENFLGSDWTKFIYKGDYLPHEPFVFVNSATFNPQSITPAYSITTELKLTAPAQNPNAINSIEIGYIQHVSVNSATATYGGTRKRTGFKPHAETVGLDWLDNPLESPGETVRWPWYADDTKSTQNPIVSQGTVVWTGTISMEDSPQFIVNVPTLVEIGWHSWGCF